MLVHACSVPSFISDSLQPRGLWSTRFLCPWSSPGKSTGMGHPFLLQGIFLTQGSKPGLPHCGQIPCHLSQQGSHSTYHIFVFTSGIPSGSEGEASARSVGDQSSIPGSGRSPGEGSDNPFQHSCLENSMDGGAWWATVHGVATSQTRLCNFTFSGIFPFF